MWQKGMWTISGFLISTIMYWGLTSILNLSVESCYLPVLLLSVWASPGNTWFVWIFIVISQCTTKWRYSWSVEFQKYICTEIVQRLLDCVLCVCEVWNMSKYDVENLFEEMFSCCFICFLFWGWLYKKRRRKALWNNKSKTQLLWT